MCSVSAEVNTIKYILKMRELARKKSVTHVFPLSIVEYNVYTFSIKDGFLLQYISNSAIISLDED